MINMNSIDVICLVFLFCTAFKIIQYRVHLCVIQIIVNVDLNKYFNLSFYILFFIYENSRS